MAKRWVFPVAGGGRYSNDWGAPRSGGRGHEGTDIFAPTGTPVVATEDGRITAAGDDGGKGGLRIWLNGKLYYAHLSGITVKAGQKVKAGQVIGYVGTSGNASGTEPHLHFGFDPKAGQSAGNSWQNPFPYLRAAQNKEVPAGTPAPVATTTTSAPDPAVAAEAEYNRAQSIAMSQEASAPPGFGVGPDVVVADLPGSAPAIAPRPKAPQIETWQALSILPHASPDTMRYLQMAQLGYGDDGA